MKSFARHRNKSTTLACDFAQVKRKAQRNSVDNDMLKKIITQILFTCSKSTIKAQEKGVKYVQS